MVSFTYAMSAPDPYAASKAALAAEDAAHVNTIMAAVSTRAALPGTGRIRDRYGFILQEVNRHERNTEVTEHLARKALHASASLVLATETFNHSRTPHARYDVPPMLSATHVPTPDRRPLGAPKAEYPFEVAQRRVRGARRRARREIEVERRAMEKEDLASRQRDNAERAQREKARKERERLAREEARRQRLAEAKRARRVFIGGVGVAKDVREAKAQGFHRAQHPEEQSKEVAVREQFRDAVLRDDTEGLAAAFSSYRMPLDTLLFYVSPQHRRVGDYEAGYDLKLHPDFYKGYTATCLHLAAYHGCKKTAQWLLERGATRTLRDIESRTPMDVAIDDEMKRMLCAANRRGRWAEHKPTSVPIDTPVHTSQMRWLADGNGGAASAAAGGADGGAERHDPDEGFEDELLRANLVASAVNDRTALLDEHVFL